MKDTRVQASFNIPDMERELHAVWKLINTRTVRQELNSESGPVHNLQCEVAGKVYFGSSGINQSVVCPFYTKDEQLGDSTFRMKDNFESKIHLLAYSKLTSPHFTLKLVTCLTPLLCVMNAPQQLLVSNV
ncbi:hypothetical protein P7K49_006506, partial [Saguinus oedipus]